MDVLKCTLLGSPEIYLDETPLTGFVTAKAQALLFYVATLRERHSRDHLATLLWSEMTTAQARKNLRATLLNLRQLVGSHLLITRQTVTFNTQRPYQLDVEVLETVLAPSQDAPDRHAMWRALDLYRGEFLAGFYVRKAPAFEEWVTLQRQYLRQQVVEGLTALAHLCLVQHDHELGLAATQRLLHLEPWHETAHQQRMRFLAHSGQYQAALAQYDLCRQALADALDIAPTAETTALYERIRDELWNPLAEKPVSSGREPAPVLVDWGEIPRHVSFYGRPDEVAQLQHWALVDRDRLLGIWRMGGQGKTALAAHVVRLLAQSPPTGPNSVAFTCVIWRSLLNAPPLSVILHDWFSILCDHEATVLPSSLDAQLAQLIDALRQRRCLLVLDNFESILQHGGRAGQYRPDYEIYDQLIERLAHSEHQSCLLLTSRESPHGFQVLKMDLSGVKSLHLAGLPIDAGQDILQTAGLCGAQASGDILISRYSGNPLALKLVSIMIQDIAGGDIETFLDHDALFFDDIRLVLEQQRERLSPLELELMLWLAVEREPVSPQTLQANLAYPPRPSDIMEALRGLQRRCLVEQHERCFGLQNVVLAYMTEWLITMFGEAIESHPVAPQSLLNCHALLKARAKDYVRNSQSRLILQPVAAALLRRLGPNEVVSHLRRILETTQRQFPLQPGYLASNILHLLLALHVDVQGYDLSQLTIWQADLRQATLVDVNFAGADLSHSTFVDNFSAILGLALRADGRYLAASTTRGEIHLWHADTLQPHAVYHASTAWLWAVAFSPDGALLASGDTDGLVYLWEVDTGHLCYTLRAHTGYVRSVAFSPDGQWLASAGSDQNLCLWHVADGALRHELSGHTSYINAVAFSPDGQWLASAGGDQTIALWDLHAPEPGAVPHLLQAHTRAVTALAFSPDGRLLASGSADHTVRLWEIDHRRVHQTLNAHTETVLSIAFSPDGHLLASGNDSSTIRLWAVDSGQCQQILCGHKGVIWSLVFTLDSQTLVSGSNDSSVRCWDVNTGQVQYSLHGFDDQLWDIAHSHAAQRLISGNGDRDIHVWDMAAPHLVRTLKGHDGAVRTVALSPDEMTLASGGADGALRLWDMGSGQLRQTLNEHTKTIFRLAFSPTGQILASCDGDGRICLWCPHTGRLRQSFFGHQGRISGLDFSPDGQTLASGGFDPMVYLWDVDTGEHRHTLSTGLDFVISVTFSRDGKLLAISSTTDFDVQLWDVQTGQLREQLRGHTDSVDAHAFCADGVTLATASLDQTIGLWNLSTGQRIRQLAGHTGAVRAILWSDADTLISTSSDSTIRMWDKASGACLMTLQAQRPYAGMNIAGAMGLSDAQQAALKALGAVEKP